MSALFDRHTDDLAEDQRRHYVASQLGIDPDDLDEFPFEIEEQTNNDNIVTAWIVRWEDDAPDDVITQGEPGSLWSKVQRDDEDYEPEDDG